MTSQPHETTVRAAIRGAVRKVLLSLLLGLAVNVLAQPQVSIAPYYEGRQAALSLTFDDGLLDQYTLAYPQLKARGLKATFAVIGSKVGGMVRSRQDRENGTEGTPCMTWQMLREMAADGQEIASHGWNHRNVTQLDDEALRLEVERNDSAIVAETGVQPLTFVYPGNGKSPRSVAYCEQGRVGSRTAQLSLGSKRTTAFLRSYLDSLIARGGWGVTMTHGIATGYDHFADPQVLWQFLDDVSFSQSRLWVAPFRDVAAYVKERDHTSLNIKHTSEGLLVRLSTPLDSKLFCHDLTLIVRSPVGSASQGGRSLPITTRGDSTLINVNPHGGVVLIKTRLVPHRLTVEGRSNPEGLDVVRPRLGWQIHATEKNVMQKGYRLQMRTADGAVWAS